MGCPGFELSGQICLLYLLLSLDEAPDGSYASLMLEIVDNRYLNLDILMICTKREAIMHAHPCRILPLPTFHAWRTVVVVLMLHVLAVGSLLPFLLG